MTTKHFILQCWSSNEHDNGECDLAAVSITDELRKEILQRAETLRRLQATDKMLISMKYWSYVADVFSYNDESSIDLYELASEVVELAAAPDIPERFIQRTEMDSMVLTEDGVHWLCYPKNSDIRIETATIFYKLLKDEDDER